MNANRCLPSCSPRWRPDRRWRCIIPANGFYELQVQPGRQRKQPRYIHPAGQPFFSFAGLTERWQGPDGPLLSCAPDLQTLLGPAPDDAIVARPVGHAVGNARNEGPQLIEPLDTAKTILRTEPGSSR